MRCGRQVCTWDGGEEVGLPLAVMADNQSSSVGVVGDCSLTQ